MQEIPYILEGIISHKMSRDGETEREENTRGEFTDRKRRAFSLRNFKNSMANIHGSSRDEF